MDKIIEYLKELVLVKLGTNGVLLILLSALGVYAWFQHQRAKLLHERIELEAEKKRQMAEELTAIRHASPSSTDHSQKQNRGLRVLAADDEPMLLDLIESIVSKELSGVAILKCIDGTSALEKTKSEKPDLLILDLIMPGKTGYEVLKELRVLGIETPVIVISGYTNSLEEIRAHTGLPLPNVVFLGKPFKTSDLLRLIRLSGR